MCVYICVCMCVYMCMHACEFVCAHVCVGAGQFLSILEMLSPKTFISPRLVTCTTPYQHWTRYRFLSSIALYVICKRRMAFCKLDAWPSPRPKAEGLAMAFELWEQHQSNTPGG